MSTENQGQEANANRSIYVDLSQGGSPFTAAVMDSPSQEEVEEIKETVEDAELDTIQEDTVENDVGDEGDEDVNAYYYLGEKLKKDGYFPETVELDEKIDASTVYNAYRQKLQEDLEPQIRQEVVQKLQQEGFTDSDLLMARAIRNGVDTRLLSTGSMFETYSTLPDDSDESTKSSVIQQMYRDRRFKDDEIKKLIASAEADDNVDSLFVESKEYFGEKYNQFVDQENERFSQLRQQQENHSRKVNETIRTIITTGEVLGEKLSKPQLKEFEDAIRKENQIVEVSGTKYRASEMQKFLVDMEQSPEMKFLLFKLYKFRNQEQQDLKTEIKKEVEDDFLKGFETKLLSSKRRTKVEAVKNQLETNKGFISQPVYVDLSK